MVDFDKHLRKEREAKNKMIDKRKEIIEKLKGVFGERYQIKMNPDCNDVINIWREEGLVIYIQDILDMYKIAEGMATVNKKIADVSSYRSEQGIGVAFQIILEKK